MPRWFAHVGITFILAAFIGVLTYPSFRVYLRKTRTSEAATNVRKIYDGQIAYFNEQQSSTAGFVTAGPEPRGPETFLQVGNWEKPEWRALRFKPDGPVHYTYSAIASGTGTKAAFTARAVGDYEGDGFTSLFERVGSYGMGTGEVEGGAGLYTRDDLE